MQVRLVYHGDFQALAGGKQVEMLHLEDSATIASLTSRLASTHPDAIPHIRSVQFLRGGRILYPDAQLMDGDIIDISMTSTAIA